MLLKRPDLSDCTYTFFLIVKNWISLLIQAEKTIKDIEDSSSHINQIMLLLLQN